MCGIAGILGLDGAPVAEHELRRMCDAMSHRGPDDDGFFQAEGIGLAMRRLSIIDLATGKQPVHNEDASVWAVFNGEIYNYKELRLRLEARGHSFRTATDTETIVHLYEEEGPRCVERMRGMFAFAVWDARRRTLLLARDRVGIKPLYYGEVDGRLVFASELKSILELPEVERRLNWQAVSHLFTFLSTSSTESVVAGIRKLEPGHVLVASPGRGARTSRYWDLEVEPEYGRSEEQVVEGLRAVLDEAVRLHMVSDVPVGAFLSGGVDSSAVVSAMVRHSGRRVKTFSIGFTEEDWSELAYARIAARRLGTDHHEWVLGPEVADVLDDLAWHLDEPFGDSSAIPTYMVSKLAAEHVKVVLSGDGGDEVFAGYDKYAVEERERGLERRLPAPVRAAMRALAPLVPPGVKGHNFLRHFSLAGHRRYLDSSTLFRPEDKARLFRPEALALFAEYDPYREALAHLGGRSRDWLSAIQYLDIKSYLPLDILTKVDRASMAHSLETRVPLLDHKLVEFAAAIPPELKLRRGAGKYVFKRALEGILPREILHRPKRGFAIPLGRWMDGVLGDRLRDLLLSERTRRRGIFDTGRVEALIRLSRRNSDLVLPLWTLASFELWCRTFLEGRRPARRLPPLRTQPALGGGPLAAAGLAGLPN
jgi:asparagine synthase (glutamine-hydrolysing)